MNNEIKAVILAAGKGTRMKSNTPKVLHKIFEKPLLGYVLDNVKNIVNEAFVIAGHHAEEVTEYVEKITALQNSFAISAIGDRTCSINGLSIS